jgi:hypothetical protein
MMHLGPWKPFGSAGRQHPKPSFRPRISCHVLWQLP